MTEYAKIAKELRLDLEQAAEMLNIDGVDDYDIENCFTELESIVEKYRERLNEIAYDENIGVYVVERV